jgi:5-methylcytosine-specific restriction endonuclease McrA
MPPARTNAPAREEEGERLICGECGETFSRKRKGPRPTYCSASCRNAHNRRLADADGRAEQRRRNRESRLAAEREAQGDPRCPYCGEPMSNRRRKQCGSPDCKRQYNADRMRAWQREYRATTGQWYTRAKHGEQQRTQARQVWAKRRAQGIPVGRQRYPDAYRANDAKRRMRRLSSTVERFSHLEVFERDGWVCGVCRRTVDRTLVWPHPLSPTLDHIVPLSEHGEHSRANSRLAHARCNTSRGARGGGEQLLLIG